MYPLLFVLFACYKCYLQLLNFMRIGFCHHSMQFFIYLCFLMVPFFGLSCCIFIIGFVRSYIYIQSYSILFFVVVLVNILNNNFL